MRKLSKNETNMINEILSRFKDYRQTGQNRWMAICPVHNEKTPSLSIKQTDNGKIIMFCFGCGASGLDVINSIGLNPDALFPPDDSLIDYSKRRNKEDRREYFNAHDVLVALQHEINVVMLAAQDITSGYPLSDGDYFRVKKANRRISKALNFIKTDRTFKLRKET